MKGGFCLKLAQELPARIASVKDPVVADPYPPSRTREMFLREERETEGKAATVRGFWLVGCAYGAIAPES